METTIMSPVMMETYTASVWSEAQQFESQVITKFALNDIDKYGSNVALNVKAHEDIKLDAFRLIDKHYTQTYNVPIDKLLHYKQNDDEVILIRNEQCLHYLIKIIGDIVSVIKLMSTMPNFKYCSYIFLPYCKQLRVYNAYFTNDYCCEKTLNATRHALEELTASGNESLAVVKRLRERLDVMIVFTDPVLYECYICRNASTEKNFLKPNECCGFNICGMCYAQLWQHCTRYPVCPVCKTSFKTFSNNSDPKSNDING
ncbi:IE-0 [Buzura suppressaria nucleopolyhedrovirus]|uniref:IE-0 n=1 Tax=Buzura suppressaria nuclear polyhedrosis virus TaxID=74320 RepID=W5VKA9_NPVBS|nr:IE-0 [Buzura suppressaria nucleopolyhedrovirus]AHH82610.1 IE-0 [Buzura suppressaria nucleopolyhedrovirus]AKN90991.1 IE-0 [Buzura suppressaria nucleopolyhedrovirus]QYF10600.1 immediate early gene 0 [Buzura suppressaria nucleopolyhedrovirus]